MKILAPVALAGVALFALAPPALAASTAYRFTDLDLRDPHVYVNFVGCRDITDTALGGLSVNGDLQARIQADGDGDGLLDLNLLIVFDPLDQAGPGGPMRFGETSCTAPAAGTTCGPSPYELLLSSTSTNAGSGQCLGAIPGTLHTGYAPALTTPSGPCFASAQIPSFTLSLLGGGALVRLHDVQVAATYDGSPATTLVNGLLRGFLTEADANATIISNSVALVGGQPLSALLPGGDPPGAGICCTSFSDMDTGPGGERGWWMYFNFAAQPVPYAGPSVGVEGTSGPRLALSSPNPSRASVALTYHLEADGPASIAVYDLGGRLLARPVSGWQTSGAHSLVWDGRLDGGAAAAAGMYVIRLTSANGAIARKIVLLR